MDYYSQHFKQYFREIIKTPLLDSKEEAMMFKELENARSDFLLLAAGISLFRVMVHDDFASHAKRNAVCQISGRVTCSAAEKIYFRAEAIHRALRRYEINSKNFLKDNKGAGPMKSLRQKWIRSVRSRDTAHDYALYFRTAECIKEIIDELRLLAGKKRIAASRGGRRKLAASLKRLEQKIGLSADAAAEHGEALHRAYQRVVKISESIYKANLRLVIYLFNRHPARYATDDSEAWNSIQEGNLGLMRAVEGFKYRRGYKFSTYASRAIQRAIRRSVENDSRTIRIPVHMQEPGGKYCATGRMLPTTVSLHESCYRNGKNGDDEDDMTRMDCIADPNAVSPEIVLEADWRRALQKNIRKQLRFLPERDRTILKTYFGLNGLSDGDTTLREIGHRSGLSQEGVRVVIKKNLRKLRFVPELKELAKLAFAH